MRLTSKISILANVDNHNYSYTDKLVSDLQVRLTNSSVYLAILWFTAHWKTYIMFYLV